MLEMDEATARAHAKGKKPKAGVFPKAHGTKPTTKPEEQLADMMVVLDSMGLPADPDPVNRLKRLTSAYIGLTDGIKKIAKQARCLKKRAKLNKGW